jgi:hypothetical protein
MAQRSPVQLILDWTVSFYIDRAYKKIFPVAIVHFGPDTTQTWLLVRLKQPEMPTAPQTAEAETKGT